MGRVIGFAITTFIITVVNAGFGMWIASIIGNRITELFTSLNEALGGVL